MKTSRRYENGKLVEFTIDGAQQPVTDPTPGEPSWPMILRPMKLLAKSGDKGLGDIVERTIGPVGGEAYKKWYLRIFGHACGCTKRKDNLNQLYPLPA